MPNTVSLLCYMLMLVSEFLRTLIPGQRSPSQTIRTTPTKLNLHNAFCLERDVWTEIKAVRADFSTVVSAVSQAYGPDFFSYVQKYWENLHIRRLYKINTPEGYTLYDSSLKEPWNASLVLAALEKQFKVMGVGSFTSTFGKKAHADLISYENLRAQRAREIDELYTRPFEDIVVEEFISNLPGPTIEELDEPMEQAGGSAEAAPADSPSGEMAGVEEAKQEPDSNMPMDTDVPMDTDMPEGSPSGEVSGAKAEEPERTWFPPTAHPDDPRKEETSETGEHAGYPGSSSFGEAPVPEMNFSVDAAFRAFLIARITCMFPCLCAQGSSVAEYLDFSRIAVKRDTCVLVCLYALRGFTCPSYVSGGRVVIIYLFPSLGFVVAAVLRPKNSCCSSWNPESLASGQSLQLSNSEAFVSSPISFCFLTSLLKKALLPGPPAREFNYCHPIYYCELQGS